MKTFATSKHLRQGSASVAGVFARIARFGCFASGFSRAISLCQMNQPSQESAPSMRHPKMFTRWYEDCGQPGEVLA